MGAETAMARGGGGQCDELCGGIFIGLLGIGLLIVLGICFDAAWRYNTLKSKYPDQWSRWTYIAIVALIVASLVALGLLFPAALATLGILTGLLIAFFGWIFLMIKLGRRRSRY